MQIGSVFTRFSDPAVFGSRKDSLGGAAETRLEKPAARVDSAGRGAAVRGILKDYDVTNISPRRFSEMLQSLRQAGALTEGHFQELSLIRLDLDTQGAEPDEPIDLIEYYSRRLDKLQRELQDGRPDRWDGSNGTIDSVRHWVTWLEKFAMIRAAPENVGLSATV